MKKIVVIGSPGAGKSTFAQALGKEIGIEVFHLDRLFWQPAWKEYPRDERIRIQEQLFTEQDEWIIEGTYLSSSDGRLNAADTIIFLDRSRFLCLCRVIKRRFQDRNKPRPDLPDGCKEQLSLPYILKVLIFPQRGRRLLLKKFNDIRKHENKESELPQKFICTCRSNKDVVDTLRELVILRQQQLAVKETVVARLINVR